jgi:predicted acyl esterase
MNRNPQRFVPNIMKARPRDFQPATITIHTGPGADSQLLLPMVEGAGN